METKQETDRITLVVAFDQASHGERFVLQTSDGTIYFRTPGNKAIDRLTAETAANRWNAHHDLLAALKAMLDVQSKRRQPLGAPDEGIALEAADAASKARAAIAKAEREG